MLLPRIARLENPDVDLSEDVSPSLVITSAVFLSLTWFAVGLRIFTRAFLLGSFKVDDWLMVAAQLVFTTLCALILEGVRKGMGKHNAALPTDNLVEALKYQSLSVTVYILTMTLLKLSIGVFLLRLATKKVYKYILWTLLITFTLWSLAIFLWSIFQCSPVERLWDFRIEYGYCARPTSYISTVLALSVLNVLSDWIYALFPILLLWNVKMSTNAKITVTFVLSLGIFASVATLVRIKFLGGLRQRDDLSYAAVDALVWTLVEPGVAIFASSLATIRPLLRALRIKGFEPGSTMHQPTLPDSPISELNMPASKAARRYQTHGSGESDDMILEDIEPGTLYWQHMMQLTQEK